MYVGEAGRFEPVQRLDAFLVRQIMLVGRLRRIVVTVELVAGLAPQIARASDIPKRRTLILYVHKRRDSEHPISFFAT